MTFRIKFINSRQPLIYVQTKMYRSGNDSKQQVLKSSRKVRYNKCYRITKGQSKMDNPEKLATQDDDKKKQKNKQHNMCWTLL